MKCASPCATCELRKHDLPSICRMGSVRSMYLPCTCHMFTNVHNTSRYLWVPRPRNEDEGVWESAYKVFLPFTPGLWAVIGAAVVGMCIRS